MYFFTAIAFVAFPFLVGAVPVTLNSPRTDRPISIPLSKRSNHLNDDGSVNLEKLQAGIHHTMAKFDRALSAYGRNTGEPHPLALKRGHSNERRDFVPLPLLDNQNLVWTGDIEVGTPPQTFPVTFDTSTADMYIPGAACVTCNANSFYDTSTSSTAINLQQMTSVGLGAVGAASGNVVADNVIVAGLEVTNMTFLAASTINPSFTFPAFPVGILGLGFISAFNQNSFFKTLFNAGGLRPTNGADVYGLFLDQSGPELVIGGTDSSKFSGDLIFLDVNRETGFGFWQIKVDSISANGADISLGGLQPDQVIVDSGSAFVSGDSEAISNIYSNIPGSAAVPNSNQFTIPCDADVTITMTFGGTGFDIPPSAYTLGVVSGSAENVCVGGFAIGADRMLMLGTAFLQNVYTELDQGNMRVGFAPIA